MASTSVSTQETLQAGAQAQAPQSEFRLRNKPAWAGAAMTRTRPTARPANRILRIGAEPQMGWGPRRRWAEKGTAETGPRQKTGKTKPMIYSAVYPLSISCQD